MKYRIEISSVVEAEADSAFLSLSQMPKRCPLARENEYFSQEIRQLLYGRGRNSYRVLFTILEGQEVSTVRILHIRHAAQQTLGKAPEEPDAS